MMIDGTKAILEANLRKGKLDLVGISDGFQGTPNRHDCDVGHEARTINATGPNLSKPFPGHSMSRLSSPCPKRDTLLEFGTGLDGLMRLQRLVQFYGFFPS